MLVVHAPFQSCAAPLKRSAHLIDCIFATCDQVPALDPDDRVMLGELRRRGIEARVAVWSDPRVDWAATRLCVLRSTWDYHVLYQQFIAWVDRVTDATEVRNDRRLLRWSADKSYLAELGTVGVPIVPTAVVPHGSFQSLADLKAARGWRSVVIKPSRGAAAHDVLLVHEKAMPLAVGQAHLDRLAKKADVLVQPYLKSVVTYGERALIFFHGRYSHAVLKKPFDTVLVVSDLRSSVVEATAEEIAVAMKAIDAAPNLPLYARVDLLRGNEEEIYVSEVELVEPALYLRVHDPARLRFVDAIERELNLTRTKQPGQR